MFVYKDLIFDDTKHEIYHWFQYELDGGVVSRYECHKTKKPDSGEIILIKNKDDRESWGINDPDLPEWLRNRVLTAIKQHFLA